MLPDYPNIKKKIEKKFIEAIKNEIRKDPLLSAIRVHQVLEGNALTSSSIDGYSESVKFELISANLEIPKEDLINKGPDAYFSRVTELASEMKNQESELVFKKMNEVTKKTGHVVNAKSKPLSPELIHSALEKMAIDFDEFGNPIMPSLVLHPDQFEKIKDEIPKWESDPEVRKKYRELIEKKRREWRDRENRRKLVD